MSAIDELLERRRRLLGPTYRLFYDQPLHLVRGDGVWLFDADGQRYLDCYNNVAHVGHCHPQVTDAICQQARTLNTHTRYLHENILDYAERLTACCPDGLDAAVFACSGTEANELALRIARSVSGGDGIIVTDFAYHGTSWAIAQISTEDMPAEERGSHVITVPAPDTFRGQYEGSNAGEAYASEIDTAIETLHQRGHRPAAFIVCTVLSSEGIPEIPDGYLDAAAQRIRAAGGLFIADEVQAGFGRSGAHFWQFERQQVVPDIITMGKPMGNGHPVSATVTRHDLLERYAEKFHYFNTFGGNPVSCAAANAVLDVLEQERLQEKALDTGNYLKSCLNDIAGEHEIIGDVRGSGLFIGLDLVTDRQSRAPASHEARAIKNALRHKGILVGSTGPHDNVLKIRPPMVFGREHADLVADSLGSILEKGVYEASTGQ